MSGESMRIGRWRAPLCALLLVVAQAGTASCAESAGPLAVGLDQVLTGEPLSHPVHLAQVPDGSGDLVVVEQAGRILRFAPGAAKASGVFLDLRDRVEAGGEMGLLSIAFAPDYAQSHAFHVDYTAADPLRTVVARFRTGTGGLLGDPASQAVVLQVSQPYANHNGGQLAFGPDGMLYIGLGDGGAGGDPHGNGQNRGTLLGSILRIDVSRADPGLAYAIPPDNPFVGVGDGSRPEIWAYGLRNPWRFSFDRATGALWVADVGQNEVEEVDRVHKGGNYGWNIMEGTHCYQPSSGCQQAGLEPPLTEYTHAVGRSITGGFVYRGQAIPGLQGRYVFADYAAGTLWSIPADGRPHPREVLLTTRLNISSFGEDAAGELYVLDHSGGRIFRLVPGR